MENEENNLILSNNRKKESLEISSTGYGLESVSLENVEDRAEQKQKTNPTTCGGL